MRNPHLKKFIAGMMVVCMVLLGRSLAATAEGTTTAPATTTSVVQPSFNTSVPNMNPTVTDIYLDKKINGLKDDMYRCFYIIGAFLIIIISLQLNALGSKRT